MEKKGALRIKIAEIEFDSIAKQIWIMFLMQFLTKTEAGQTDKVKTSFKNAKICSAYHENFRLYEQNQCPNEREYKRKQKRDM